MVGTGPLSSELANVAKELRIDDRVHFLGMRDDVYELLAGLDVFAMSSRFEGLPIALLEAMSAHLPVVATSVGGIPEVVTSGTTGILVRPGDPAALAHAIQGLLDDPDRRERLGDAAASRASRCDITHAVRCTEAVYDSVFERVS
jgi:glycosyltransferase involved in cell wall biosynthesis